jgi:hypothetical protein
MTRGSLRGLYKEKKKKGGEEGFGPGWKEKREGERFYIFF